MPNTFTMPQLILIISLFSLLIVWLGIFAWLALRPTPETYRDLEEMEDTAPLPVVNVPTIRTLPIKPLTSGIRTITQQTPIVTVSAEATREIVFERSTH